MCRTNGRRCPGQNSPEHRETVNARRRERYASNKAVADPVRAETFPTGESLSHKPLNLPVTTGKEMASFEFKSRLPKRWNPKKFKPVGNGFAAGHNSAGEKPTGGLWSSPIDRDEDMEVSEWDAMHQIDPEKSTSINHDIKFANDSKVLIIDSREEYDRLLKECGHEVDAPVAGDYGNRTKKTAVDYERLSQSFDAVYFTTKAVYANGRSNPKDAYFDSRASLTNLDIASLYIMNPKAIAVMPE